MPDEQAKAPAVVPAVARIGEPGLHQHALRCPVAGMRDADDLAETEILETIVDELGGPLGGKALAPRLSQQAIADFDVARRRTILEAVPADECAGVATRRVPDAEAIPASVVACDASERRFDVLSRRRLPAVDVFHHAWIAVEAQQIVEVIAGKFAQVEPQRLHPWLFHNSRSLARLGMTPSLSLALLGMTTLPLSFRGQSFI